MDGEVPLTQLLWSDHGCPSDCLTLTRLIMTSLKLMTVIMRILTDLFQARRRAGRAGPSGLAPGSAHRPAAWLPEGSLSGAAGRPERWPGRAAAAVIAAAA